MINRLKRLLPYILSALVILGLCLSYFIFYDIRGIQRLIGIEQRLTTPEVSESDDESKVGSYLYSPIQQRYSDIVTPSTIYYRMVDQTYWVRSQNTYQSIKTLIESRPIHVNDSHETVNPGTLNYLWEIEHLQLTFPHRIPLGVLNHLVETEDGDLEDFLIDRIVIPLIPDEGGNVYLMDTGANRFVVGHLSRQLKIEDLKETSEQNKENLVPMIRYAGRRGPIYLPELAMTLSTQLYTLEAIPENLLVNQIFPDSDYSLLEINPAGDAPIYRYQNYLNTLDIDRTKQLISLQPNRVEQGEARTISDKVTNTYSYLQQLEYWQGELQLERAANNHIIYRRLVNGLPVRSGSKEADYGEITFQLRNDRSGDVYRYQQPTLFPNIFIDSLFQEVTLDNHEQLLNNIQQYNMMLGSFDAIFIGYYWEKDMENFRKVQLTPQWFFEYRGEVYTYDEVMSETFIDYWFQKEAEEEA